MTQTKTILDILEDLHKLKTRISIIEREFNQIKDFTKNYWSLHEMLASSNRRLVKWKLAL